MFFWAVIFRGKWKSNSVSIVGFVRSLAFLGIACIFTRCLSRSMSWYGTSVRMVCGIKVSISCALCAHGHFQGDRRKVDRDHSTALEIIRREETRTSRNGIC